MYAAIPQFYGMLASTFSRGASPSRGMPGVAINSLVSGKRQATIDDIRPYPLRAAGYYEPSLARRFGELYGLAVPVIDYFAFTTDDVGTVQSILEGSDVVALNVNPPLVMDMTQGIVHHADRAGIRDRSRLLRRSGGKSRGVRFASPSDLSCVHGANEGFTGRCSCGYRQTLDFEMPSAAPGRAEPPIIPLRADRMQRSHAWSVWTRKKPWASEALRLDCAGRYVGSPIRPVRPLAASG
ncbi:hypothetical protein PQQ52_13215 [Paraburkholderia sediminicola]|uniref:hypothetical protein n=1 Tax=Paraburkholderia sediminicola TaxID=458836 RepID=UPI0038BB4D82